DLGDDVARLDALALGNQPLGELALLHGGRQRGHQDLGGHPSSHFRRCAICASMDLVISLTVSPVCSVAAGSIKTSQHSSSAEVICSMPVGTTWKSPSRNVTSGRSR